MIFLSLEPEIHSAQLDDKLMWPTPKEKVKGAFVE